MYLLKRVINRPRGCLSKFDLLDLAQPTHQMTMYSSDSDSALVSLWQKGSSAAFEEIYKRYAVRLVNMARLKTGCTETAKELVQDVFMSLYLKRDTLQTHTTLQTYLFTVLKNAIFNHKRQEMVRIKYIDYVGAGEEKEENQIIEHIDANALKVLIEEQIHLLPLQCKTVFLMSREEHLSNKEIAERLNISVNTVEQHVRKARKSLRAAIKDYTLFVIVLILYF